MISLKEANNLLNQKQFTALYPEDDRTLVIELENSIIRIVGDILRVDVVDYKVTTVKETKIVDWNKG